MRDGAAVYTFGECELDESRWELRRQGARVELQPKTLELLFYLVRNRSRVVSKRELLTSVWPDVAIGESSLTRSISLARRAIGDAAVRDGMIRTHARKGYRFCAATLEHAATGDPPETGGRDVVLDSPAPVPAFVRLPLELPFVGRERALMSLADAELDAGRERGRFALVTGSAGVGKTRLLDESARRARRRGCRVVAGCGREDEGSPPFWPWIQILRQLLGLHAHLVDAEHPLREALGAIEAGTDDEFSDRARGRFRTFDAITRALDLASRSASSPLVILLDDMHRADVASWLLLRHLNDELRASRCSLVLALRDGADAANPILHRVVAEMRRSEGCRVLALEGFALEELKVLVERAVGRRPPEALIDALARETEGNPFYVREVLRGLEECGELDAWERRRQWNLRIPGGARESVRWRIRGLSATCREVLEPAAVLGREFSLELLVAVADTPRTGVLDALDQGIDRQIVAVREASTSYSFTHALVRDVLYEGLPSARCAELHRRAGEALEKREAREQVRVLALLAHHFSRAAVDGESERAIAYSLAAARQADAAFAHEDAALHYARARGMLESRTPVDAERLLGVLLELGRAQGAAGNTEARREAYREAADTARVLALGHAFAEAALGHCGSGEWRRHDASSRALLEEALLRTEEPALRARLLARLAHAALEPDASRELSREALRMAERSRDDEALCEAHHARHYVLEGPDDRTERACVADAIVRSGTYAGRSDLVFEIHLEQASDALMRGDRSAAEQDLAKASALAAHARQPWFRWLDSVSQAGLLLLDGALERAEPAIERAFELGRRLENPWAGLFLVAQKMVLERARGTPQALEPLLASTDAGGTSSEHLARAWMAGVQLELGRPEIAREILETFAARGFASLPRGSEWLATLTELAHVAASLQHAACCAQLTELLGPYASLHVSLPYVVCYGGPVDAALARTVAVCGARACATTHFEAARSAAGRVAARAWQLRIDASFGCFLLDAEDSRELGRGLLNEVAVRARALGLGGIAKLAAEAERLRGLSHGSRESHVH